MASAIGSSSHDKTTRTMTTTMAATTKTTMGAGENSTTTALPLTAAEAMAIRRTKHRWLSDDEVFEDHPWQISDHGATTTTGLSHPPVSSSSSSIPTRRELATQTLRDFVRRCASSMDHTCARLCCRDGHHVLNEDDVYQVATTLLMNEEGLSTPTTSFSCVSHDNNNNNIKHTSLSVAEGEENEKDLEEIGHRGGFYDGTFPLSDNDLWDAAELHQYPTPSNQEEMMVTTDAQQTDEDNIINPYDSRTPLPKKKKKKNGNNNNGRQSWAHNNNNNNKKTVPFMFSTVGSPLLT